MRFLFALSLRKEIQNSRNSEKPSLKKKKKKNEIKKKKPQDVSVYANKELYYHIARKS